MRLHQLKLDFIPEQDRLLLRVSTDNQLEVRLWLTRRALRLLWPLLLQMVRSSPEVALQSNPQARDALVGMQHEQALRQANFADAFEEAPREMPLGAEPILVARIQTNKDDSGNQVLALLPQQGQGIHLTLDNTLLHSLCKLLQNAVAKSDWDIVLELPTLLDPGARRRRGRAEDRQLIARASPARPAAPAILLPPWSSSAASLPSRTSSALNLFASA